MVGGGTYLSVRLWVLLLKDLQTLHTRYHHNVWVPAVEGAGPTPVAILFLVSISNPGFCDPYFAVRRCCLCSWRASPRRP